MQRYFPKLDGLRAVSIGLVLIEHFFYPLGSGVAGLWGVTIFFVISGYLITSSLMAYRDRLSLWSAAKNFYWRRAVRLIPAYYSAIAITALLNIGGMRHLWIWAVFYLMNLKVAIDGGWNGASHFWSLAVEEQFYLLWFFVVVAMPRKYLLPAVFAIFLIAPVFRGLAPGYYSLLLPGVMDSMAAGALMAVIVERYPSHRLWRAFNKARLPILGIAAVLAALIAEFQLAVFSRAWIAMLAGSVLVSIAIDSSEHFFRFLGNSWLRHVGRISYGIYIYHYFLPGIVSPLLSWIPSLVGLMVVRGTLEIALSIGIAQFSWVLIEKPLSRWKDVFNSEGHAARRAPSPERLPSPDAVSA